MLRHAGDHQLRQLSQFRAHNAGAEDQADRLSPQPARHEPQHLRRGTIKPLSVINHAHQRPASRHLRQQAKHPKPDQEPVRRRPQLQAERGPQRPGLRRRQSLEPIQHRRAQLMQPGERQLHLRLHPRRARHPATRGVPGHVLQQRRLAHARLTVHHQRPALSRTDRLDQLVEHTALSAAAQQLHSEPPFRETHANRHDSGTISRLDLNPQSIRAPARAVSQRRRQLIF